jgi:uncharacterized membrane protein
MNMKALPKYFLQGSLVLAPIAVTLYVLYLVVAFLGDLASDAPFFTIPLAIALVILVGFVVQNVVGKTLLRFAEQTLQRVPFIGLVYSSIRDLIGAFVGERKSFDQPVAVTIGASGAKVLGFVTRREIAIRGLEDHVAVYLPQSYNFAGNLIVVHRDQVQHLDCGSSELMTFIVSGAISGAV